MRTESARWGTHALLQAFRGTVGTGCTQSPSAMGYSYRCRRYSSVSPRKSLDSISSNFLRNPSQSINHSTVWPYTAQLQNMPLNYPRKLATLSLNHQDQHNHRFAHHAAHGGLLNLTSEDAPNFVTNLGRGTDTLQFG
jgi:hypothetical protein